MRPLLRPIFVLAWFTCWGGLRGFRGLGLFLVALLPTFAIGGLAADGVAGPNLINDYEGLTGSLTLPLVLLLVSLLLAVPLLREDIDDRSISYLLTRTMGKPVIVVGKYLGYAVSALAILLPTTAITYGVVAISGQAGPGQLTGVLPSLLVATTLGVLAYGAIYLLFGTITKHALIFGLLYGFLWEYLIGGLTGIAPDLSVMHFLLSVPTFWVTQGPLSSYTTSLTLADAVGVPLIVAAVALLLTMGIFRSIDLTASGD